MFCQKTRLINVFDWVNERFIKGQSHKTQMALHQGPTLSIGVEYGI